MFFVRRRNDFYPDTLGIARAALPRRRNSAKIFDGRGTQAKKAVVCDVAAWK